MSVFPAAQGPMMSEHITDTAAEAIEPEAQDVVDNVRTKPDALPGPSTNPATNLIIADIVMRGVGRIVRNSLHKGVLRTRYSRDKAKNIVENRSAVQTLAIYGITKIATRSVPGALLVGGGLVAKTLYDRGQSRRVAKKRGDEQLDKMAEEN